VNAKSVKDAVTPSVGSPVVYGMCPSGNCWPR
jgi:hypothetical protein